MPNVQSTYGATLPVGFPGRVSTSEPSHVISRAVEGSAIAFGRVVIKGTNGELQCKDGSTGTAYMGIALVNIAAKPANVDAYAIGDIAAIMIKGSVWVTVAANVAYGDSAYFTAAGDITNVSTSNTAIPNGKFASAASSGGLAELLLT